MTLSPHATSSPQCSFTRYFPEGSVSGAVAYATLESVAAAVTTVAMQIFIPKLFLPALGVTLGFFATRALIHICTAKDFALTEGIQDKGAAIRERIPFISPVVIATTVAIGFLSSWAGAATGIFSGVFTALTFDDDKISYDDIY